MDRDSEVALPVDGSSQKLDVDGDHECGMPVAGTVVQHGL